MSYDITKAFEEYPDYIVRFGKKHVMTHCCNRLRLKDNCEFDNWECFSVVCQFDKGCKSDNDRPEKKRKGKSMADRIADYKRETYKRLDMEKYGV